MNVARAFRVVFAFVNVALVTSCQKTRPPMTSDESRIAQQLSGSWDMTLRLVSSPLIAFDTARAPREIRGKIDLLVNTSLGKDFTGVGVPTNYGSYDLDLTAFGFDPRIPGTPPAAVAGIKSRDSIAIVLSPGSEEGRMVLAGRLEDGTVSGIWHVSLARSDGSGLFLLTRSRVKDWK